MARKAQAPGLPGAEPPVQAAALPWRRDPEGAVEVLLVTSRETRRWVLPKGWPIKGLRSAKTAEREAFEEAGVKGRVGRRKVGVFHYDKRLAAGLVQRVQVGVYPLKVEAEHSNWPEMREREKLWTSPAAAADLVQEPDLAELLRDFAPE
jgi:8-oxo-dGTP pyrophosphatase MutT (NUDIX family)